MSTATVTRAERIAELDRAIEAKRTSWQNECCDADNGDHGATWKRAARLRAELDALLLQFVELRDAETAVLA